MLNQPSNQAGVYIFTLKLVKKNLKHLFDLKIQIVVKSASRIPKDFFCLFHNSLFGFGRKYLDYFNIY